MYAVAINGLLTGFILQLAIGPVFFFILNIALQRTLIDGLLAVLAVTLVDYLYIILAVFGVGKLLENNKIKRIMGIVSSIVLIIFGAAMLFSVKSLSGSTAIDETIQPDYLSSFSSAFFLTISSPLTIVFWTGLFAAKAIEKNYQKKQLWIFGLSAGLPTLLFLGVLVTSSFFIKMSISPIYIEEMNILVGLVLVTYGFFRCYKVLTANNK